MRSRARWLRIAGFWAAFLVSFTGIPFGVYRAMERAEVEEPYTNLGPMAFMRTNLDQVRRKPHGRPNALRVAFFGDSVMASYPEGRRVNETLEFALRILMGRKVPIRVIRLALPGMGPFDYYFLADEVAAAHPAAIVYAFNLASLGVPWRRHYVHPQLAGWLPARRVPEAFLLPLHWIGLTSDELLFYLGLARALPFDAWYFVHRQQARVGSARTQLAEWVDVRFGRGAEKKFDNARLVYRLKRDEFPKRKRFKPPALRAHYGEALSGIGPEHPVMQVLGATLRVFRNARIPTLVFITPLNVDYMATVDSFHEEGLDRTIRTVEEVARANGAAFVDLHRLLPDAGFRDAPGHLAYEGEIDGPMRLGGALAPSVLTLLNRQPAGR